MGGGWRWDSAHLHFLHHHLPTCLSTCLPPCHLHFPTFSAPKGQGRTDGRMMIMTRLMMIDDIIDDSGPPLHPHPLSSSFSSQVPCAARVAFILFICFYFLFSFSLSLPFFLCSGIQSGICMG